MEIFFFFFPLANFVRLRSQSWKQRSRFPGCLLCQGGSQTSASWERDDSGDGHISVLNFKSLGIICNGVFDLF